MKRSPSSTTSSSSTSSSSSCAEPEILQVDQSEKPKAKRARKENGGKSKNSASGRRSSIYRGVTRHRWTGRYEAHLWDKSSWNNVQNKKGRQGFLTVFLFLIISAICNDHMPLPLSPLNLVYLGAYDSEEAAARTYDLAALKYWGPTTTLNFPIDSYTKEIEEMEKVTKEEYLASLRRRSSGFSRGVSKYRGVARHHHNGRWEARIGRVFGNKYLYLGTYKTQEEAAAAYDMAAIEYRGANAVTNFDISNYIDRIKNKTGQQNLIPNSEPEPELELEPEPGPEQKEDSSGPGEELQCPHQLLPCLDSSTMAAVMIEPPVDHELISWSFLDAGFVQLPVPDLPIEKPGELLDLFDNTGFEDNIDLIFGSGSGSGSGSGDSSEDDFAGVFDKLDGGDGFGVLEVDDDRIAAGAVDCGAGNAEDDISGRGDQIGRFSSSSSSSSPSSSSLTRVNSVSCM